MDLAGKKVWVVGLGQTGAAVARFCHGQGAIVYGNDGRTREKMGDALKKVEPYLEEMFLGGHPRELFEGSDYVVMSPGVPEMEAMGVARGNGIPVIAEIELAYRYFHKDATLIAITGTNGKSTTTSLCGALCEGSSRPVFCGGNLGNQPLIEAVQHPANSPGGIIVAEVAGFMLETCTTFAPDVAVCTNIEEDHLDRYGTMDVYTAMKQKVFAFQTAQQISIANARNTLSKEGAEQGRGQTVLFDSFGEQVQGAWLNKEQTEIVVQAGADRFEIPTACFPLVGLHNMENAMAAVLAAFFAGVSKSEMLEGVKGFSPCPHRMEFVSTRGGIRYYDDSKGTNVAAVAASLAGFPTPVVLIAGGVHKGAPYTPMFESLEKLGRGLVLLGEAAPLIEKEAQAFGVSFPVRRVESMEEAVQVATAIANSGDSVVLSPACSSYDMFRNFEERGHAFRNEVEKLTSP